MSKKSHRRQAKPAAVQAYPVSDALGDVLSRAPKQPHGSFPK